MQNLCGYVTELLGGVFEKVCVLVVVRRLPHVAEHYCWSAGQLLTVDNIFLVVTSLAGAVGCAVHLGAGHL